jgi:hypothetical protein
MPLNYQKPKYDQLWKDVITDLLEEFLLFVSPDLYEYVFGTELTYCYNTYHITSQSESALLESQNPFALAMLAGLYAIKGEKNSELVFQYKYKLRRLVLQDKIMDKEVKREYIQKLFVFIDHLMLLPDDANHKLINELKPIIEKEGNIMGLSLEDTSFAKFFRKEGVEEGLVEGERRKAIEITVRLLKKGMSIIEVAETTELSIEEVEKIQKGL